MNGSNLITVTRLKTLKRCPREHYYRYEAGIAPDRTSEALRIGSIYHVALDMHAQGKNDNECCKAIHDHYAVVPEWADPFGWAVERETVLNLFMGYVWRWQADGIEIIESENGFKLPIINPETGAATPLFKRSGKVDKKVRLPDGRVAIMEHKTTKDPIDAESDYWSILRIDPQVSMYFDAADDAVAIIYDVTRKPAISPKLIDVLDNMGLKIVNDRDGNRVFKKDGIPRQTGDTANGYEVRRRRETPEEFGKRLLADITERPEFYYARMEVPRLADDMEAFRLDLWDGQKELRFRQKSGNWSRSPDSFRCGMCSFKAICFNNVYPINGTVPDGFKRLDFIHPELAEVLEDDSNSESTSTGAAECAATASTESGGDADER